MIRRLLASLRPRPGGTVTMTMSPSWYPPEPGPGHGHEHAVVDCHLCESDLLQQMHPAVRTEAARHFTEQRKARAAERRTREIVREEIDARLNADRRTP